jgi:hypothetical protein
MFRPLMDRRVDDRSAYDREDSEAAQRQRSIDRVLSLAQAQHWPVLMVSTMGGTLRTQHREAAWRFDVQRWGAVDLLAVLQALGG